MGSFYERKGEGNKKVGREMEYLILLCILLLAFLYSSVGHGGASGYLAIMALFGFEPQLLRSSALLLNVVVSGIAFVQYYRKGYFKWKVFLPFAAASVPMAFIGGRLDLTPVLYQRVLGVCLIFAVLRITGILGSTGDELRPLNLFTGLFVGAVLGLVSGLIGIGGGIMLSPVILLFHWAKMKTTAAVSALFIFVNSAGGLAGLYAGGHLHAVLSIYQWTLAAVIGGLMGGYLGSSVLHNKSLRYMLAVVLAFAGFKLIVF